MKQTRNLRNALWTNAVFMEAGALLFFLGSKWNVINELSGGFNIMFGIEFLAVAALFTAGALTKQPSKTFIWILGIVNTVAGIYFFEMLLLRTWSMMAKEMLALDALFNLVMAAVLFIQVRRAGSKEHQAYAS